jgi:hypothetical protein
MQRWILKFAEAEAIVCLAWSGLALGAYSLGLAIRAVASYF